MREYRMGGSVGSHTALRRIYPAVLSWIENRIKTASGKRYAFIKCTPKASGPFATALVLDPEISQQKEAGREEYSRVIRRMPVEAELPWEEPYRGRYITHSPIGNQLMSHAVSVIIPIVDSLEEVRELSMEDWRSVLDYYLKNKDVDPQSLFLVATKEYAGLAMQLATTFPVSGLIIEEPEAGVFGMQLPKDAADAVAVTKLQAAYETVLEQLNCNILVFRHRNNPAISMNDRLILKPLIDWQKPLYMSLIDFPLRTLSPEDLEQEVVEPRYCYDTDSSRKITQRMLYFIQQQGETPLSLLPEQSTEPRSSNRANSLISQFEQSTQRLNQLMSEASGEVDSGNVSDDGSDGGEEF